MARRIIRRSLIPLLLIVVLFFGIFWWRYDTERKGRKELAAVSAEIDATDPRWRWDDMVADQPELRDEENAAKWVAEFRLTVGIDRYFYPNVPHESNPRVHWINAYLNSADYATVDKELAGTELAWPIIEALARTPRGRTTVLPSNTWLGRQRPREEHVGSVLNYLGWEAEREARNNDPFRQQTIARAYLNAARIEDLSDWGSPIDRRLRLQGAARLIERTLALNCLGAKLAHFQNEFTREAEVDLYRAAARLERAAYDRLCQAIATGEPSKETSLPYWFHGGHEAGLRGQAEVWLYRPHFAADWAAALSHTTNALSVADLPDPDRTSSLAAIPSPPNDGRHLFSKYCAAQLSRHLNGSLNTKAMLRCTAVGLAVERYRLLTGDWPATLDAIPQAILPAIPSDPFTGKPLDYSRRPDGVTVFAAGAKRCEFRLFDPFWRGIGEIENGPEPRVVKDRELD